MSAPVPRRVLLEVAVASVEDARTAATGGADRLELNTALALGGLTPSPGLLLEVCAAVTLPVIVMIRPRAGGFCYSPAEYRVMQRDIEFSLANGASGIAFGILTPSGEIDRERTRQIVRQIDAKQPVVHRAFDGTPDPFAALEHLIDLGVKRVMTSGQEETAYNGAPLIAHLIHRAAGRIEILPAGGINRFTVADVVERTRCDQVHAALRTTRSDRSMLARPHVGFSETVRAQEDRYPATSAEGVTQMRELLGP